MVTISFLNLRAEITANLTTHPPARPVTSKKMDALQNSGTFGFSEEALDFPWSIHL
jgi:hypothetical protein